MSIPEHHQQWFEQLLKAARNGDLALVHCLDAQTKEPRSVICLVSHTSDDYEFIPLGHLSPNDDPCEAYIPPEPTPTIH